MPNTYNTGISFSTSQKIEQLLASIGHVDCVMEEVENASMPSSSSRRYTYKVLLVSPDIYEAIDCVELLCAAKCIIDSHIGIDKDCFISNIYLDEYSRLKKVCPNYIRCNAIQQYEGNNAWYWSIVIAQRANTNMNDKVAILKYYNARILYDMHPMDLNPNINMYHHYSLLDKLRMAYSIIDIHSIIEELRLEIRAGSTRPSVIENRWNPIVLNDLEKRLKEKRIDPDRKIAWLSRVNCRRPFKSTVINSSDLCEWADGSQVLDFHISIKDAILELDYLRDKRASHCVGERVQELDAIDLENAFHLLRTMLLDYFMIDMNKIH